MPASRARIGFLNPDAGKASALPAWHERHLPRHHCLLQAAVGGFGGRELFKNAAMQFDLGKFLEPMMAHRASSPRYTLAGPEGTCTLSAPTAHKTIGKSS